MHGSVNALSPPGGALTSGEDGKCCVLCVHLATNIAPNTPALQREVAACHSHGPARGTLLQRLMASVTVTLLASSNSLGFPTRFAALHLKEL